MNMLLKALVALSTCALARAHVALTFPPARKYDLDFLDTFRTDKPCGMTKGDVKTVIAAGKDLEITWHLGYPHRGGFKLDLLDGNDQLLRELTPPGAYEGESDPTAQSYRVSIPASERCLGCSIRLQRQALEWGADYRFQSCASVDIVPQAEYREDCLFHGTPSGDQCRCEKNYFGDRCQYKNDCEADQDCNNHGRCIDLGGTALPRKQCFCEPGFMGIACERESAIKVRNFTQTQYERLETRGIDFYWRILNGSREFEGVIVGKKTPSWVAVGWRPTDILKACQRYPLDALQPKGKDFHAMDCTDIIIGAVRDGSLFRIDDYYTRDRSTPRLDSFYGGQSDLTGALGWEEDGRTFVMFRRTVRGSGDSDHEFHGGLNFIWAHGQITDFYKEDELKYHGGNRGVMQIHISSSSHVSASAAVTLAAIASLLLAKF